MVHTGPLEPVDHGAEQLLGARDPKDAADAVARQVGQLALGGVLKDLLGHDEGEQLGGVGRGHDRGRNAPLERVEVDIREERAPVRVGLVGRVGIRVVIVVDQPVSGWHIGDEITRLNDVAPEAGGIYATGEDGADTNDGNRALCGVVHAHRGTS